MKFAILVLVLFECGWICYYLGLNVGAYSSTGTISEPTGRSIRQDVACLGTHVGTVFGLASYLRHNNYGHLYWIGLVFIFEGIRDTFNLVNIIWYTPMKDFDVTRSLWHASYVIVIYQLGADLAALTVFLWSQRRKAPSPR
jgi:hypothetical protein